MAFEVRITPSAERDIADIYAWLIDQYAGEAGMRWFANLVSAFQSLSTMPRRCGFAEENDFLSYEVRELLYGKRPHVYRIVFTIEDETVQILHIWHGRRLPFTHG